MATETSDEGLRFQASDYVIPHGKLGLYGIESIHIKKHVWPKHNAVLHGALLWDNDAGRQYFVPSHELAELEVPAVEVYAPK